MEVHERVVDVVVVNVLSILLIRQGGASKLWKCNGEDILSPGI